MAGAVLCLLGGMGVQPALAGQGRVAGHAHVQSSQQLAVLLSAHPVHSAPEADSPVVTSLAATRPITGEETTVPVIAGRRSAKGVWLRVMLPGRPNGSSGWIAAVGTKRLVTAWRITVDLGARRVIVYHDGSAVRSLRAVVGKPSTPTPTGSFFVEETVLMPVGQPGGPLALALSARSDALQTFEGGPGQIAIHGRDGLGGVLGRAESHGCVRMSTGSIEWLADRIDPGTPVTIEAS
jgi:lipoprotein-anchoring transpeptidase ErfK/SrfK